MANSIQNQNLYPSPFEQAKAISEEANRLINEGKIEESLVLYEQAAKACPNDPQFLVNYSIAHFHLGHYDLCHSLLAEAIALRPNDPNSLVNLGMLQFTVGNWQHAWSNMEYRFQSGHLQGQRILEWRKTLFFPEAKPADFDRNHDLQGKSLLVLSEQGFGDIIMAIRFISPLIKRGMKIFYLNFRNALVRLLDSSYQAMGIELLKAGENVPLCDYYCGIMSLPYLTGLATTIDNLPPPAPWQAAWPLVAKWQRRIVSKENEAETTAGTGKSTINSAVTLEGWPRLNPNRQRTLSPNAKLLNIKHIGIAISGRNQAFMVKRRSLTWQKLWEFGLRPLIENDTENQYQFYNLQKFLPDEERDWLVGEKLMESHQKNDQAKEYVLDFPIMDWGASQEDFADLAAQIASLDAIITVDTAHAHLAGSLGAVGLLLLAEPGGYNPWGPPPSPPDRDFKGRPTIWYPSITELRQLKAGDWDSVLQSLPANLARILD